MRRLRYTLLVGLVVAYTGVLLSTFESGYGLFDRAGRGLGGVSWFSDGRSELEHIFHDFGTSFMVVGRRSDSRERA